MDKSSKRINGQDFKILLEAGYSLLDQNTKLINELNVFPVPDGDTGTNMRVTFLHGIKALDDSENISDITEAFARGALFGARGNSGVLLSQYYKGISLYLKGKADASVKDLLDAMKAGYDCAYNCTLVPTEGTILTVAREGYENVVTLINDETTIEELLKYIVEAMKISLDNTPNLLPVLKESGVIDSGGKGLLTIYEGFLSHFNGEVKKTSDFSFHEEHNGDLVLDFTKFNENSVLDYGYCTEFLLQLLASKINISSFELGDFIKEISPIGDSIVATVTGTIVKVHIHTKEPDRILKIAQKYGEFLTIKIENMSLQHNSIKSNERIPLAIISIANGDGIISTFKELGCHIVLNGGQTMNTSIEELLTAFKEANADNIILLPNNPNVLLAVNQAKEIYKDSKIYVAPTITLQEGYSALSMMMGSEEDPEVLFKQIQDGHGRIYNGFVAKSFRDSKLDGITTNAGDYVESIDHKIVGANKDIVDAVVELFEKIPDIDNKEVAFSFYGQSINEEIIEQIQERLSDKYPYLEVGFIPGKQDVYDFLFGIVK